MIFNLQLQDLHHFEYFRNVGCYEISHVFVSYKIYCTLKSIHVSSIWSAATSQSLILQDKRATNLPSQASTISNTFLSKSRHYTYSVAVLGQPCGP